jgi:hypothetical protein
MQIMSHSFEIEDILGCGTINPIELESYSGRLYTHRIRSTKGEQVLLTELDMEFIFIFSIGSVHLASSL